MLIEFSVENFKSFRTETTLSMLPSREQKFRSRLPFLKKKYNRHVLPVAGIYGANASGKTVFIEALRVFKELLTRANLERESLPFYPFKLSGAKELQPTQFIVLFSDNDAIYQYSISYNRKAIVFEQLIELLSKSDKLVFERNGDRVEFGEDFADSAVQTMAKSLARTVPIVAGLALFETSGLVDAFTAPHRFAQSITVIPAQPEASMKATLLMGDIAAGMTAIGAGVVGIAREEVDSKEFDYSVQEEWQDLLSRVKDDSAVLTFDNAAGKFEIARDGDRLKISRIKFVHAGEDGHEQTLNWSEESDGTKTLARLLPLFASLAESKSDCLLLIDEIDRSFHPALTLALVRRFLETCNENTRSQLIFSTHDLLLMDPKIFRKDEINLVQKNAEGYSELYALSSFVGLRNDKDIRKSYIDGRLGGVPGINQENLIVRTDGLY